MNNAHAALFAVVLVLGIAPGDQALADDLGKLFTTTAERARIDALRSGRVVQDDTSTAAVSSERVVVNGTLRGSDGKRLVWLNGAPVNPTASKDLALLRNGNVQLSLQQGTRTLKPGQGIDQASGQIFDYHTPAIAPTPATAAALSHSQESASAAANPGNTPAPGQATPATPSSTAGAVQP